MSSDSAEDRKFIQEEEEEEAWRILFGNPRSRIFQGIAESKAVKVVVKLQRKYRLGQ